MKFYTSTLNYFIFFLFLSANVFGQCGYNGEEENGAILTIGCNPQSVSVGSGAFQRFNVTNGVVYSFNTCGSGYNTQITGFNSGGGYIGLYNDDNGTGNNACGGGSQSGVNWTATYSGQLRIQMNTFNCTNWPGGGSATLTYRIVPPTTSTNGGNKTVCPNTASASLGGSTPTVGTGTWTASGPGSVTFSPNANTPNATATAATPGSYTLTWTINNGGCTSASSLTFTVNTVSVAPASIAIISGTNPSCPSSNVTLQVNGGSLGTNANWQWYSGGCGSVSAGSNTTTINVTPSSQTTYNVRAEGGCVTPTACASLTITMNTTSSISTVTASPTSICTGQSSVITVNGSLGTGASWNLYNGNSCGGSPIQSINSPSNTFTVTPSIGTNLYSVRAVGTCNTTTCLSATVVVNPLPAVAFSAPGGPFCASQTTPVALTASGSPAGGTGVFSGNGVSGNTFIPSNAAVGNNTLTYTYTDLNGCVNSTTRVVSVTGLPSVSFTGLAGPYCVSQTTPVLLDGNQNGGTYSGPGITNLGSGNANFTPSTALAGVHNITYSYTDGNGCVSSQTQSVQVIALPVVQISGLASAYCVSNASVQLTGFPSGGTFSGTGVTSGGLFSPSTGTGNYTITYSYTNSNGCTNTTQASTVVNALPSVNYFGFNVPHQYCANASVVNLTGSPVGGTFSGPGVTSSGVFTPATAGVGGPYTITYTYTNGNGCTNTASQAVTVVSVPTVSFSGLAGDYCVNDFPVLLTGNQSGGTFSGSGITNVGSGIAQFSPTAAGIGGSYSIIYSYTNGNGCAGSQTQQTVVHPQPVVAFSGLNSAYCIDATPVTLTGSHAPGGSFTGNGITNNGNGTATLNPATAGVGGPYTITYSFTDGFGCSSSISGTTLVNDTPTVSFTGYSDLCIDQAPLVLTGTPSGGVFTGNGISGNAFYPNVAGLGDHVVTYTYNDGNSCNASFSALIRVYDIPQVTQQPQDIQVCPGDNATFTVAAVGLGLTYQWQLNDGNGFVNVNNGGIYSGATSPSLTLNGVPPSLDGYQFNAVITGATCFTTTTSSIVTITENPSPTINTQPVDYAACSGDNAVFSVNASGTSLTYQWQVDDGSGFASVIDGGVYSGATTNTLNITGFTSGMDGYQYQVVITGSINCTSNTISDVVTLTETTSPNVITQPVSQSICEGDNAVFTVAATGSGLTYQWQEDSGSGFANISNGGAYSGATSATLTVAGVTSAMDGNQYQCIISGSICVNNSTTTAVALNITTSPFIALQPADVYVCPSDPTSFSVTVQGSGITYQWQVNNGSGFTNIINGGVYSGATTAMLNVSGVFTNMDGFQYQCIVNGTFCSGTSTSQVATIYINGAPVITLDPSDTQYCEGDNAVFTVNATGTGLSYQWQVNNGSGWVNLANGVNYNGVYTSTLSVSGIPLSFDGNQYQVIVSGTINCSGTATSAVATLTENPAPFISSQPVDAFICDGGNVVFNATANGTGLTYQWQENTGSGFVNVVDGGAYSGATTSSLTVSGVNSGMDGYQYQVLINGTICTATATSVAVTLNSSTSPVVTTQPVDVQVCPGDAASYTVAASGSNLSYQWEEDSGSGFNALSDGGIYSGTNSATLNLSSTTLGMNGNQYRVIVSSTDCPNTTLSNNVVLNINTSPVVTTDPIDVYVCQLDPVSFSVTASGTGLTYQWQENTGNGFVDIVDNILYSGSNTPTLSLAGSGPWMLGYQYRVVVSGTINCSSDAISNYAVLYINSSPLIATQPTDQNYCVGDVASFGVTANGSFLTYQWQVNDGSGFTDVVDGGVYSGATTATLSLAGIPLGYDGYQYQVIVSGSNNCSSTVTSVIATLNEDPNPFVSSQPVDQYVCPGDVAVFAVTSSGTGLTYQWQEDAGSGFVILADGGVYSGTSTNTLTITGATGMDGYIYRCVITGTICTGTSVTNLATLHETTAPYISVQPLDQSVCDGDNVILDVTANGTGLTYQWQVNTGSGFVNATNGSLYNGATTSTLSISATTLAMDGYQYQVIINGTICVNSSTSNTVTLNVGTGPNITLGPANQVICDGDNTSFSATVVGNNLTYGWQVNDGSGWDFISDGGVYSNSNTSTLTITGADVSMNGHQYQLVVAGSVNCSVYSTSTSAVLLVNPLPVVSFSGLNSEYCVDATLTPLTGAPTGGTFSGPGIIVNDFSASTAGVGGPYTILYEYTDGNGCYNSTTQTVSVNPLPVVSFTGLAGPYCINDNTPVQLSGTPAGGMFSGPGINGLANQFVPSNASVGTVSVTYTYTDGNGCTSFQTQSAVVNDIPALTLSGPNPAYCVDDNTPVTLVGTPANGTFSGSGVTGGTWTASDAGVGTHTITYTYTDGNNCTNTTTISVVVNGLPVVTFTGLAANYCVDAPADALTGIPINGTFTSSGSGINANDFDPALAGVGTHDVTYTYSDVNGCINSETQSTTVYALPVPVISPATVSFCDGDYAILDAGTGYSDYGWSTGFNGQQSLVDAAGQVTVTVTDINGCIGTSAAATVVVNTPPVVDLGSDTTICTQVSYTINAGYPGSTYDWSTGESTQSITVGASGVYAVTVVDQNGCEGFDYTIVTVSQLLTPLVTSNGLPTFCEGDSIVLSATSGYTTYLWSNGLTTESITVTQPGFYQVFVTNSLGCDGFSTPLIVTTLQNPSPAISADGPLNFCPGEDVVLNAGFGYSAFEWQPGLENTQTLTVTQSGDYSVTVTGSNGCSATAPAVTVEVFPIPNPVLQADGPLQFCDGGDVTLSVQGTYASYLWTSGSTTPEILVTESGQYGVIVMDLNGCVDSSQVVNPITVTVWDPQPFIIESGDTLTCSPAFASYQWYENDTLVTVPGATSQILITQSSGNYTVVVTDANGCTGESNIIEHSQTGINDIAFNANISIYPNPTRGVFTFNADFEGYENLRIELTNALGQLVIPVEDVRDVMTIKREYNLNHLPDGVYVLMIRTEKGNVAKRIVKN